VGISPLLSRSAIMKKYDLFLKVNYTSNCECYHTKLTVSELNQKIKTYSNYSWVIGFEILESEVA
jgi:hypothetical protein